MEKVQDNLAGAKGILTGLAVSIILLALVAGLWQVNRVMDRRESAGEFDRMTFSERVTNMDRQERQVRKARVAKLWTAQEGAWTRK